MHSWLNSKFFMNASGLALIVLVLAANPAWSQSSNGSVRGIVQDPTSAIIPNVTVVLTNTATGVELRTQSNGGGIYVFPSVIPGSYKVVAESAGMTNSTPPWLSKPIDPPTWISHFSPRGRELRSPCRT